MANEPSKHLVMIKYNKIKKIKQESNGHFYTVYTLQVSVMYIYIWIKWKQIKCMLYICTIYNIHIYTRVLQVHYQFLGKRFCYNLCD